MKSQSTAKKGLYASYNEKNGPFDDAVRISNELGYVTWLDKSRRKLDCPTVIFIRLTGEERYFRGTLCAIRSADNLDADFAYGERDHRPKRWQEKDVNKTPRPGKDFRPVFIISHLHEEVQKPAELARRRPPQGPVYVDLETAV
jgi:hypothetical protein